MKTTVRIVGTGAEIESNTLHPLYATRPAAGFPSPVDDSVESMLDLNRHIVKNPASTFFVRVEGDSMEGAGIFSGDILVVDRSLEAKHGSIVVASIFEELTVKRLNVRGARTFLVPENDAYEEFEITEEMDSTLWGVVTHTIKSFV